MGATQHGLLSDHLVEMGPKYMAKQHSGNIRKLKRDDKSIKNKILRVDQALYKIIVCQFSVRNSTSENEKGVALQLCLIFRRQYHLYNR